MSIGMKIKDQRKKKGFTQVELAEKSNMSRSYVADIERDRYNPSVETLKTIADALGINPSELIDDVTQPKQPYYALNDKDERDIARDLERMMSGLDSNNAMAFYGEEMDLDEEERELLRASMEQTLRLAKQLAKKKFTPKKYRKE